MLVSFSFSTGGKLACQWWLTCVRGREGVLYSYGSYGDSRRKMENGKCHYLSRNNEQCSLFFCFFWHLHGIWTFVHSMHCTLHCDQYLIDHYNETFMNVVSPFSIPPCLSFNSIQSMDESFNSFQISLIDSTIPNQSIDTITNTITITHSIQTHTHTYNNNNNNPQTSSMTTIPAR